MRLGVVGGHGRFGRHVVAEFRGTGDDVVVLGRGARLDGAPPEVVIDVSAPDACDDTVERVTAAACPLIHGTSGITEASRRRLHALGEHVPVVLAVNFSRIAWLHRQVVRVAAALAAAELTHAEVVERHGRHKRDAVSATARLMADDLDEVGLGARVVALRHGGPINDHATVLETDGASLTVTSNVWSPGPLVAGVVRAVEFGRSARPGLYTMDDVWAACGTAGSGTVNA